MTLEALGRDFRHALRSLSGRKAFAITALLSLALGIGASFVPARRASRVDPMTALRCE